MSGELFSSDLLILWEKGLKVHFVVSFSLDLGWAMQIKYITSDAARR